LLALAVGACSSAASPKASTAPDESTTSTQPSPPGVRPFAFTVRHERFVDTTRPTESPGEPAYSPRRALPTDLYIPTSSTPRPLIMFSHGYHGAPRKFTQLFRAWARAGYMVAAPRFPLTSDRGDPYDSVADVVNQPAASAIRCAGAEV
jgi:predicted dienelactone hydrolase